VTILGILCPYVSIRGNVIFLSYRCQDNPGSFDLTRILCDRFPMMLTPSPSKHPRSNVVGLSLDGIRLSSARLVPIVAAAAALVGGCGGAGTPTSAVSGDNALGPQALQVTTVAPPSRRRAQVWLRAACPLLRRRSHRQPSPIPWQL